MKTQTQKRKRSARHERMDIELFDINAYKRIQAEHEGVSELLEQIDVFQQNFNCSDIDHTLQQIKNGEILYEVN